MGTPRVVSKFPHIGALRREMCTIEDSIELSRRRGAPIGEHMTGQTAMGLKVVVVDALGFKCTTYHALEEGSDAIG